MNFCAEYSRASQEQLFGTAKRVNLWLLIEHSGRWEKEAAQSLPPEARTWYEQLRSRFPKMRLALIRQDRPTAPPLSGFLAAACERVPRLFSFSFHSHHELPSLDLDQILAGPPSHRQLFLVCTHGTHDRCCAKFGNSLFDAMQSVAGGDAWRVSHVGGCRFAPNVVVLPEGIVYGRVEAADCEMIRQASRTARVIPRLLRGRSSYDHPAQAAEYFLRMEFPDIPDVELRSSRESRNEWICDFDRGDARFTVRLTFEDAGVSTFKSCSAADPCPRGGYRLISCTREALNPERI